MSDAIVVGSGASGGVAALALAVGMPGLPMVFAGDDERRRNLNQRATQPI